MCDVAEGCICEVAVRRVYREMRKRNASDRDAFDIATQVYRFHHPEVPLAEAPFAVAEWLDGPRPDHPAR